MTKPNSRQNGRPISKPVANGVAVASRDGGKSGTKGRLDDDLLYHVKGYWDCVHEHERDICSGPWQPPVQEDRLIESFNQDFDQHTKFLAGWLRRQQAWQACVVLIPPGLTHLSTPFAEDCAHVALHDLLNPPSALYGDQHFLLTENFRQVKQRAQLELQAIRSVLQCAEINLTPQDEGGFDLRAGLYGLLISSAQKCQETGCKPMTQQQMGEKLKKSQPTISKMLKKVLGNKPMEVYHSMCSTGHFPRSGHLNSDANGSRNVDGIAD